MPLYKLLLRIPGESFQAKHWEAIEWPIVGISSAGLLLARILLLDFNSSVLCVTGPDEWRLVLMQSCHTARISSWTPTCVEPPRTATTGFRIFSIVCSLLVSLCHSQAVPRHKPDSSAVLSYILTNKVIYFLIHFEKKWFVTEDE